MTKEMQVLKYEGKAMSLCQGVHCPIDFTICVPEDKSEARLTPLHPPVMCKDYIQDAFWSEHTGKSANIYGFSWTKGTMSIKTKWVYLALGVHDKEAHKQMKNVESMLNAWDSRLGFEGTTITPANGDYFILKADAQWFAQPIRISLLTFLIRVGRGWKGGTMVDFMKQVKSNEVPLFYPGDSYYASQAEARIRAIFNDGEFPKQTFDEFEGSGSIHNSSGICGYKK